MIKKRRINLAKVTRYKVEKQWSLANGTEIKNMEVVQIVVIHTSDVQT